MKSKVSLMLAVMAVVICFSCGNQSKAKESTVKASTEEVKKDCSEVHWKHSEGEDGPENWKNLCDGFSDCGGMAQSPVDISTSELVQDTALVALEFNYDSTEVDIINNHHTVQFNVSGDNLLTIKGKDYKLLQFHYHTLSEHTIDGSPSPMEVHFVHQYSASDFAVVGVMFAEGEENELFSKYLSDFPVTEGEFKSEDMIALLNLLPESKNYYHYSGSLTTPPCSEVVSWYVLENPVEASKEQIESFSNILKNNYRPVLPLNGRKVKIFSES